jgi:hypothetical protein
MSSNDQKQASRENGALGGIKTKEGKDISRQNAIQHGILAYCATGYDLVDIKDIYSDFVDEFGARSPSRQILIQQLSLTVLRLARCARAETEILREALDPRVTTMRDPLHFDVFSSETIVVAAGDPATITSDYLERIGLIYERYEPKLFSRFLKLLVALEGKGGSGSFG